MVRIITQETYDEVVKENIDEFDMTPEDAIKEAVAQFQAQGVDLSNIIKDLSLTSGDEHLVCTTIGKLKELFVPNSDSAEIVQELNILKTECEKDIAHRVKAGKEGAYKVLIDYLEKKNEFDVQAQILETLTALMDMQPDLLDEKGIKIMKRQLDVNPRIDVLVATLQWLSVCCTKHEQNRQNIFKENIVSNLCLLLKSKNKKVLSETLQVMRRLTLDDDIRVEFGKAHDHAREIAIHGLQTLTALMKENSQSPLISELMLTIATLLVRSEFCQVVADAGGTEVLFSVLADNYENVTVVRQALKLVTALCGNDTVKRSLMKSGMAAIITSILDRHMANVNTAALTLKCISALTLREPKHGVEFVENGAPEAIIQTMKMHRNDSSVQKFACSSIRNMVTRTPDQTSKFHELGAEAVLNEAFDRFESEFGFEIKSALLALECEVKLEEQWTGKGVQLQNDT